MPAVSDIAGVRPLTGMAEAGRVANATPATVSAPTSACFNNLDNWTSFDRGIPHLTMPAATLKFPAIMVMR